jgi:tRNA modification GTPase
VEINCHGGLVPSQTILHDLAHSGIPTMPWRALAERNRLSPIETESLDALTRAQTLRTASILLDQAQGALASRVQDMLRRLGGGELAEVATNLCQLLQYSELGLHLVAPWRVAIVGRPNVGKSSLLNAMVGYHRALVHPTAGTTRDLVTATTAIDGWPVEFADCAGIRLASDELEAAGVARARLAIAQSDRQLVVFDASEAITDNDEAILHLCPNPLVVANKSDLPAAWNPTQSTGRVFATSALRGAGIADLLIHLATFLVPNVPPKGEAVPFTARQLELLNRAQQLLQDRDVSAATECLHRLLAVPAITEFPRPADLAYLASADG